MLAVFNPLKLGHSLGDAHSDPHWPAGMPKARFSSLDVAAIVSSLRSTVLGYRISNVYDINPRTYLLKLARAGDDAKLFVLIESGVRVHLTTYERDKAQIPSNFTLKLRKHVRTRRIEKVEQLGADRVIVITCGSGVAEHKLIIELYDKGNLVLTDAALSILTLLRSSKHDPESRVTVHDRYPIEVRHGAAAGRWACWP